MFEKIKNSYLERSQDLDLRLQMWDNFSEIYPPNLSIERPRPSLLLSMEAGDVGLSIFWIVQSTIVRGLFNEIASYDVDFSKIVSNLKPETIGALAHSENPKAPFTITEKDQTISLNGKKNYITGGTTADILLLTGRETDEEKVSKIVFINDAKFLENNVSDLKLNHLKTTDHGSLTLSNYSLNLKNKINIKPKDLQRSLKKWNLIEKILIIESFVGLLIFLNGYIEKKTQQPILSHDFVNITLSKIEEVTDNAIKSIFSNEKIETYKGLNIELKDAATKLINFSKENSLPEDISQRFKDLTFFLPFI